jgi:HJR/Mrr/RecB family endonuclease
MINLNLLFEVSCLMEPCLAVIKIHEKKRFVYTEVRYFFTLAFKRSTMREISDFCYELIRRM